MNIIKTFHARKAMHAMSLLVAADMLGDFGSIENIKSFSRTNECLKRLLEITEIITTTDDGELSEKEWMERLNAFLGHPPINESEGNQDGH